MGGSFGPALPGRALEWHRFGDPPGGWAYSLDQQPIAEFWWSPEDREVRAEAGSAVWRMPFQGLLLLRAAVIGTDDRYPRLVFAGSLARGLLEVPSGPRFTLFTRLDTYLGPWIGIDDESGDAVLRIRGRIGRGRISSVIEVTPNRRHSGVFEPLLVLWGGLSVLRQKFPWLSITTRTASESAAQHQIERMLRAALQSIP